LHTVNLSQCAQLEGKIERLNYNILLPIGARGRRSIGRSRKYTWRYVTINYLITLPWAFNSYAPQTDDDSNWKGWWFLPSDRRLFGMVNLQSLEVAVETTSFDLQVVESRLQW